MTDIIMGEHADNPAMVAAANEIMSGLLALCMGHALIRGESAAIMNALLSTYATLGERLGMTIEELQHGLHGLADSLPEMERRSKAVKAHMARGTA